MTTPLKAVIFDVDGTLVDSERHGHRVAFNAAFAEAGLGYHWDEATYGRWLRFHGGVRRIDAFLEDAGLAAAERQQLAPRLHEAKTRLLREMIDAGRIPPRPGMPELVERLVDGGVRLGVATVGSAGWVTHLLDSVFPPGAFEVVVTAAEVTRRKPHPGCYLLALERLGVGASNAVAIEDSAGGLNAAVGAGVACLVVVNDYTAGEAMPGAHLVLDGVDAQARVLDDPYAVEPSLPLDLASLQRVLAQGARPAAAPVVRAGRA